MNKSEGTLTILTEKHDNLAASAADRLSDDELNVMDEVELTVLTVSKMIRLFFFFTSTTLYLWLCC